MHFTDVRAFDLAEKMIDIFHDQFDFRFLGNRVIPIHLQTGAASLRLIRLAGTVSPATTVLTCQISSMRGDRRF